MSRSPSSTDSPSRGRSTADRAGGGALFDELDDLLQRMLELPVRADDASVSEVSSEPAPVDDAPFAGGAEAHHVAATAPPPPVFATYEAQAPEDEAPLSESQIVAAAPEVNDSTIASIDSAAPSAAASPENEESLLLYPPPHYPLWMRPFVWMSARFDRWAPKLGHVGDFLQSSVGKTCLGITGVMLFLMAMSMVLADWMGWSW